MKRIIKSLFLVAIIVFISSCKDKNQNTQNSIQDSINQADTTQIVQKINLSAYDRSYNDLALWLAGQRQDENGLYKNLEQSKQWQNYSSDLTLAFNTFNNERVTKIDSFRQTYLNDANEDIKTLFYPYSGPDFINARLFFPNADTIIMAALEPIGEIPDFSGFSEYQLSNYFEQIISSLRNILNQGYFITKKMKVQYTGSTKDSISGVLPIIFVFMIHSGCQVLDVQKITIDKNGNVMNLSSETEIVEDPKDEFILGVKIDYYAKHENKIKTMFYFSHDIGEPQIDETPEFLTFLGNRNINVTFLKAASYLNIWFAKIRNITLEKSDYILQDDSGIPIKYIDTTIWDIKLFGTYTKTLDMFRDYFQSKLRDLYKQEAENVIPLHFSTGYNGTFEESNLQLFTKK